MGALETALSLLPYGVDSSARLGYANQYLSVWSCRKEKILTSFLHFKSYVYFLKKLSLFNTPLLIVGDLHFKTLALNLLGWHHRQK